MPRCFLWMLTRLHTAAMDTTDDDEAALGNCLDEDNIVILQNDDLFAYLFVLCMGGDLRRGCGRDWSQYTCTV